MNIETIRRIPCNLRADVKDKLLDKEFDNKYCKKCKLYKLVKNPYIEGRGSKTSDLFILGESPGATEDAQGQVFVGKAGNILQKKLNQIDIDYFLTNSVKCRSVDEKGKNKTPTPKIIKCCKPFTIKLITEVNPKVILVLGKIAMSQIIETNLGMTVARGNIFYHPELNCHIVMTYHPMYLGYSNDRLIYRQFEEDLDTAKNLCFAPPKRILVTEPKSLDDACDIKKYLTKLLTATVVSIDLETEGLNFRKDKITDISFCSEVGKGVHIKWNDIIPYMNLLSDVLKSNAIKVFMNGIFDLKFFRALGLQVNNYSFDIMLAEHTLTMSFEGREVTGLYKLDTMVQKHTDLGSYKSVLGSGGIASYQSSITKKDEVKKESTDEAIDELDYYNDLIENRRKEVVDKSGLTPIQYYSALDADAPLRIYYKQKPLIDANYKDLFYGLIMPLTNVLVRLEENGIRLDVEYMKRVEIENQETINDLKSQLYKKVGRQFDLDSPKQLADVLFNSLNVTPNDDYKTPKGAYSTNIDAIKYYSKQKPILKAILDYRSLSKQNSTYLVGFREFLDPKTDRVHPSYMQHTTATGRLSVINPALQTIPRDNKIRNMVIPSEGNKLLVADLSQMELRILAEVSGDKEMLRAFKSGEDIHATTACNALLKIDIDKFNKEDKVHSEMRSIAKTINFGIIYGLSAYSLATQLEYPMKTIAQRNESLSKAQGYIDNWFRLYSDAKQWLEYIEYFAIKNGYVESVYGRRRYLPNVYSSDPKVKEAALRQARNMPIQSTASDINNIGLIRMQKWLDENNKKALLVGVVHDSILSDCPEDEVDEVSKKLVECMTKDIPKINITLKADLEILDRWSK